MRMPGALETVIDRSPTLPSTVAVMRVAPGAIAKTTPVDGFTAAIVGASDAQVTRPTPIGAPSWSSPDAFAPVSSPTSIAGDPTDTFTVVRTRRGSAGSLSSEHPARPKAARDRTAARVRYRERVMFEVGCSVRGNSPLTRIPSADPDIGGARPMQGDSRDV